MKEISFLSIRIIAVLVFITLHKCGFSQVHQLNFGLNQLQDSATLPVSKAKPIISERKAKTEAKALLQKVSEKEFILTSGWEMTNEETAIASDISIFNPEYNTSKWYNATVPGTVLTTLVDQGVYPDPYFGLNNLHIPDSLCRTNWWYRISFRLPSNPPGEKTWLLFNGINYRAHVWLNGKKLGGIKGAFKRGEFDISNEVRKEGDNILAVQIFPPYNPGIPHEQSSKTDHGPNGGLLCLDGPTFISSEGWDWVPGIRDRNIGIWQDVRLRFTGSVSFVDTQIITDLPLPDTTEVSVKIKTGLKNHSNQLQKVKVIGSIIESIEFSQIIDLDPNEYKEVVFSHSDFSQLNMENPKLWWPNGYGRPELYTLNMQALVRDAISDQEEVRFGVREFSYELSVAMPDSSMWRVDFNPIRAAGRSIFNTTNRVDVGGRTCLPQLNHQSFKSLLTSVETNSKNPFLTIKVNGIPVFCRGGNWGMDDAMKRVSREKLEPYFKLHQQAGFNMIRNWTGESTEEVFYELADEYGMLIWNDFWLSTETYNLNVADNKLFMENARDVVRRFRNHASIAVWCPRNEGYAPGQLEPELIQLIATEDGTRYYSPNSRNLNLRPSGPWNYQTDPARYYREIAEGFSTELGTPSVPTAATIRSFIPKEDQWPISDTWRYHDLHTSYRVSDYLKDIADKYGESQNLDDFCKKAQMVNYDSHRAMFEAWNSKLWNNASGLLLWMTHPAWPSMTWQTYSWDYETFGSYYGAKKACEPIHIQMNLHDNKVVVINTTLQNYDNLTAILEIFDLKGKKLFSKNVKTSAPANRLTDCFQTEFPKELPSVYLSRLILKNKKQVLSENEYWKSNAEFGTFSEFNNIENVIIIVRQMNDGSNKLKFEVTNSGKIPAISLKFNIRHPESGKLILPAIFSDGYFTLLPGEKKMITVDWVNREQKKFELVAEGYNLKSRQVLRIF